MSLPCTLLRVNAIRPACVLHCDNFHLTAILSPDSVGPGTRVLSEATEVLRSPSPLL